MPIAAPAAEAVDAGLDGPLKMPAPTRDEGREWSEDVDLDPETSQCHIRILLREDPVIRHVESTWGRSKTQLDHPGIDLGKRNGWHAFSF